MPEIFNENFEVEIHCPFEKKAFKIAGFCSVENGSCDMFTAEHQKCSYRHFNQKRYLTLSSDEVIEIENKHTLEILYMINKKLSEK